MTVERETTGFDIAVDFMDMTQDRRLWVTPRDVRDGLVVAVGVHAVVGDEDADPAVARILTIDEDGNLELEILPGNVESHRGLLPPI